MPHSFVQVDLVANSKKGAMDKYDMALLHLLALEAPQFHDKLCCNRARRAAVALY